MEEDISTAISSRRLTPQRAFTLHSDFAGLPVAQVYTTPLLTDEECKHIVELASDIGLARATQSKDPGLNTVLRLPVNGIHGQRQDSEVRLALLKIAFAIHERACALANDVYGDALGQRGVAPPPKWKAMPKASLRDRLLGNVEEWNKRVKFNMNVLRYTTEGGNVGTTVHRDESPLAFVIPLRRINLADVGGTHYPYVAKSERTLNPPPGTLVMHPGDLAHRGVPIRAREDDKPGERWVIAGFVGTATPLPPPRPEPPLSRVGDVQALAARWGGAPMGCHLGPRDGVPRYKKKSGETKPLHLGSRSKKSLYIETQTQRGKAYKYYVTQRCRKQEQYDRVIHKLS